MKISTSKIKLATLSLLLIAAISMSMLAIPSASAHTPPWTIPTYAYVTAAPNPVGPNQQVVIVIWSDIPPPTSAGTIGDRWRDFTVDVTKPDGTVVHVLTGGISDPVGSSYALYTPDMTGIYTVRFSYPNQVAHLEGPTGLPGTPSNYVNDTYLGASATTTFNVQPTEVSYFQEASLPVSYWTRPINENNQFWSVIGSAWLGQSQFGATYTKYNPYGWAPNTAHVSMTYPLSWGGIVGGRNAVSDYMSFYSGTQYQLKFNNPIIMYGNVYFSLPANNAPTGNGITCVDLRTGQTKWTNTEINSISFGQLLDFETPNQHGTTGIYLWYQGTAVGTGITNPGADAVSAITAPIPVGTNLGLIRAVNARTQPVNAAAWIAVDPQTGKVLFNETDVPRGTIAYGPMGEWLSYGIGRASVNDPVTYLWQWNNTKIPGNDANGGVTAWQPGIANWNMSTAYDWNVTLSEPLYNTYSSNGAVGGFGAQGTYNATTDLFTLYPTILRVFPGDVIFGQSTGLQQIPGTSSGVFGTPDKFTLWSINLNASRGPIGKVLFQRQYDAPDANKTVQIGPADGESNVFTLYYRETMQWTGYDMLTGNYLWGPTEPQNAWNYYSGSTGLTNPIGLGYGCLYTAGYGGTLYAYNLTTGNLMFTYGNSVTDPTNSTRTPETVYGVYPTQVAAVADNKVYLVEEEHSLNAPAYHGAKTRCVDAFTGKLIWEIYGISSWQMQAVADGYYTWLNLNEMQIYAMGPGPSATTVSAPNTAVPLGTGIEITGTVTDQTPQAQLKGTPAVSDADQEQQMEYLIQHSINAPTDITGVPVTIFATDSSGVTTQIAQVTSTGTGGIFHYLWTPSAVGEYVITANFAGSQAYGQSSAQTAVGIVAAASPAVTPTPTQTVAPTSAPTEAPVSPSPSVAPTPASGTPTTTYIAIAAAVVIIAVIAAALVLRRRK